jgi:selenocysteine-specific elongation factor
MRHIVVGTAGHIDHGKTALIRALTGIDTDRLEEEKRRGISIDLGFAHLDLPGQIRIAFIDVPGHERFIKNMLAGAGGIDAVLLVVAADESVKPQTREHFNICRLLRISGGLVAITKTDLITDPDLLSLVRLEIEDLVSGSFLQDAPIIPVSAKTGLGMNELRTALAGVASRAAVRGGPRAFRMPVDRAFHLTGFGTIVSGTVTDGQVAAGSEVEAHPGGNRLRVRTIQAHGADAPSAAAGQRAALNLANVSPDETGRGTVLFAPGQYRPVRRIDCLLETIPGAPRLKNRAPVHLHAGTAEVIAELRALDRRSHLDGGTTVPVRLELRQSMVLVPGDRFVIRMFSPVVTVGGGVIVDTSPPARHKATTGAERVLALAAATLPERIARYALEGRLGLALSELALRLGLPPSVVAEQVPECAVVIAGHVVDRTVLQETVADWRERLKQYHREHSLEPGPNRESFRTAVLPSAPPVLFDALLQFEKNIVTTGDFIHLRSHRVALRQDEEDAARRILQAFEAAGLEAPAAGVVLRSAGVEPARAESVLRLLLRDGRLIRINSESIVHPDAMARLRSLLEARKGTQFSVGDFKDWTGVSRKYAIPLLEYLDRQRLTRREGDTRTVL